MIEIIKHKREELINIYKLECSCGCVFKFDDRDVDNEFENYSVITCPECKETNTFSRESKRIATVKKSELEGITSQDTTTVKTAPSTEDYKLYWPTNPCRNCKWTYTPYWSVTSPCESCPYYKYKIIEPKVVYTNQDVTIAPNTLTSIDDTITTRSTTTDNGGCKNV